MKRIAILGSTGSIGRSALKVVAQFPDRFSVVALSAGRNVSLLAAQIEEVHPDMVAVSDEETRMLLRERSKGRHRPDILSGIEGISNVARHPDADVVISAISGSAGFLPTIAAVRAGKTVAIANKETLVMAGSLVVSEVKKHGARLFPVDSEHSAVFQCINGKSEDSIRTIFLTASGGPFLGRTARELDHVSPADALRHPNWSMGKKITIDSATLMNKGLEVIEAYHLFSMPLKKIDVLIHPQSIVHSIVEFRDGSCLAQLSRPDMRGPIAYALSWPERLENAVEPLDWKRISGLTFQKPDLKTFPCLSLAYSAIETGGTLPAVLNAANEVAVKAFLDQGIGFNDIPVIISKTMNSHPVQPASNLDVILEADRWAREKTREALTRR